jgi:hypothetical protein
MALGKDRMSNIQYSLEIDQISKNAYEQRIRDNENYFDYQIFANLKYSDETPNIFKLRKEI